MAFVKDVLEPCNAEILDETVNTAYKNLIKTALLLLEG
jgi:hypothetical protein